MRSTAWAPASTSTPACRYAVLWTESLPTATGERGLLEDELAAGRVVWDGLGVVAIEAGEAEALVGQTERGEDPADRQVAERVGTDEVARLIDRMGRGDELRLDGRIDAIEAGVIDRRRTDPDVDLARARAPEQLHDPLRGRAADDRVVDDDQALAGDDLPHRIELDRHPAMAHPL